MVHPRSLQNLAPWEKGQSGNPSGRPKGVVYTSEFLKMLGDRTAEELEAIRNDASLPVNQRAAARLLLDSFNEEQPDVRRRALSEVIDRTEGKAQQSIVVDRHSHLDEDELLRNIREHIKKLEGSGTIEIRKVDPRRLPSSTATS